MSMRLALLLTIISLFCAQALHASVFLGGCQVGELGRTGRAVVEQMHSTVHGGQWARKKTPRWVQGMERDPMLSQTAVECLVGYQLRHHPNILAIGGLYIGSDSLGVDMELMDGSLLGYLRQHPEVVRDRQFVKWVSFNIFSGLAYLHSLNLVHGDIKPSNIMVSGEWDPKNPRALKVVVGDLASIVQVPNVEQMFCVADGQDVATLWWQPPELCSPKDRSFGSPSDIWSAALVMLQLMDSKVRCGEDWHYVPVNIQMEDPNYRQKQWAVVQALRTRRLKAGLERRGFYSFGSFTGRDKECTDVHALVSQMLHEVPSARPTAQAIIDSEVFPQKWRDVARSLEIVTDSQRDLIARLWREVATVTSLEQLESAAQDLDIPVTQEYEPTCSIL